MADSIEHIGFWEYPKKPDPSIDYGEPGLPECTCSECNQVWLRDDLDDMGRCVECRPVEELDEEDAKWWDKFQASVERGEAKREDSI